LAQRSKANSEPPSDDKEEAKDGDFEPSGNEDEEGGEEGGGVKGKGKGKSGGKRARPKRSRRS
jgi:hypothetical protein